MEQTFHNNEPEAQKNEDNEQPMQQLNASTINGAQDYIADGGVKVNINCNNMYADASFVEAFKKWLDGKKKVVKKEDVEKKDVEEVKEVEAANVLPPELKTPKAMAIWKELQEAGYMGEDYKPAEGVSVGWSAYIAHWMGMMLDISFFYTLFGKLWGLSRHSLSVQYDRVKDTNKLTILLNNLKVIESRIEENESRNNQ